MPPRTSARLENHLSPNTTIKHACNTKEIQKDAPPASDDPTAAGDQLIAA